MPAVAFGLVARLIELFMPSLADGAFAVAVVPAPLLAAEIVTRLRGRMDLAGALVLGTMIYSLLVVGGRGAAAAGALFAAAEAFAIPAMVASALPLLRDRIIAPIGAVGWLAAGVVVLTSVAAAPTIDVAVVVTAAALFAAGVTAAAVTALLLGRDVIASVAGAGLRDPVLALAFASLMAGPQSAGIALVYGVFCLGLTAFALRWR